MLIRLKVDRIVYGVGYVPAPKRAITSIAHCFIFEIF